MASFSVYGYDNEMLASFDTYGIEEEKEPEEKEPEKKEESSTFTPSFPLLRLPYELRNQIYSYLMPRTFEKPFSGIVWRRATAPIWATSPKVYNECIRMLYSNCIFVIDVKFDSIRFQYQWLLDRSSQDALGPLVPKSVCKFPDKIPSRNRDSMRKFHIRVHVVDSYEGMIKYNYSNPVVLAMGVRGQVQKLCNVLVDLPEIRELQIEHHGCDLPSHDLIALMLGPFQALKNTKQVTVGGGQFANDEYALQLQKQLTNAYTRNSILSLPEEIRAHIYRHVLPYSTSFRNGDIKEVTWHPGDATIMRTNRSVYEETRHLLYGLSEFEFTWMLS